MTEQTPDFTQEESQVIDRLGHDFSFEALTHAQAVITQLDIEKKLSQEISQIVEAIKRQAECLIYVFSSYDETVEYGDGIEKYGVSVFKRVGNTGSIYNGEIFGLDDMTITIKKAIQFLLKSGINTVYTGLIQEIFLGYKRNYEVYYDNELCEVIKNPLSKEEMNFFQESGIKVINLLELK